MFTDENTVAPGVDPNKDPFEVTDLNQGFLAVMADLHFVKAPAWGAGTGDGSFFDADASWGETTFYRIREGIERFTITDINNPAGSAKAQSDVWVMMDELEPDTPEFFNHIPGGCNVLYMDGHVEFLRYPTRMPVSRVWAAFYSI
jgi:prepilin-type processing-associated H-X9-DG protein